MFICEKRPTINKVSMKHKVKQTKKKVAIK